MSNVATIVPDQTDLLCESCGYILNGLPIEQNCPECGQPIQQSVGEHRKPAEFEVKPGLGTFVSTTNQVIFHPRRFYRGITTRASTREARIFALIHLLLTTLLFSAAAIGHFRWALDQVDIISFEYMEEVYLISTVIFLPITFLILLLLTRLAAWLSAIEARYWGMRLPYGVVMRGLEFHRAHYLPVGLAAVIAIWVYRILLQLQIVDFSYDAIYSYSLCGLVIVSALYLFMTYWIAMKSMMFANR